MGKTPPPRRNYDQMVRVVREGKENPFTSQVPYELGKAYGKGEVSPSETRIRSLDELGINSRSPSQLQAPARENNYNRRESTTLYHQLSDDQKMYFDGVSPNPAPTRLDARPGTKTRTYLNSSAASEHIYVTASERSSSAYMGSSRPRINQGQHMETNTSSANGKVYTSPLSTCSSSTLDTRVNHETPIPKQTRLPVVKKVSLEGTSKTDLDFSLSF